jgi:hypothetical protein
VLEVSRSSPRVVRCLAHPDVLDALAKTADGHACRVAADELLLLDRSADIDLAGGLAVEETGGWAEWTLSGPDAAEALARLSALPPGPGFLQGDVAGVPAKAIVADGEIHLLVPASLAHHVEERVLAACADLLAT